MSLMEIAKKMSTTTGNNHDDDRTTTYVLVTAHPDDEAMFFVPTIHCLMADKRKLNKKTTTNNSIHLVCLSHGNYDGLGDLRIKELQCASNLLGFHELQILNDLQDDPQQPWSSVQVATNIETHVLDLLKQQQPQDSSRQNIVLLTFDYHGVSGHVNHRDTFLGVKYFLSKYNNNKNNTESSTILQHNKNVQFEGWQLDTIQNPIWKYFPFLDILIIMWWWTIQCLRGIILGKSTPPPRTAPFQKPFKNDNNDDNMKNTISFRIFQPFKVWKAMAAHQSQFVWYRRLSVLFSRYTYFNSWRRIDHNCHNAVPKKQL